MLLIRVYEIIVKKKSCTFSVFNYLSSQGQSPWLKIRLEKKIFVAKVEITNRRSCCLKNDPDFRVLLGNSSHMYCTKYRNVYFRKSTVFICNQAIKTTDVTIQIVGDNRILTLCEVKIIGFGESYLQMVHTVEKYLIAFAFW